MTRKVGGAGPGPGWSCYQGSVARDIMTRKVGGAGPSPEWGYLGSVARDIMTRKVVQLGRVGLVRGVADQRRGMYVLSGRQSFIFITPHVPSVSRVK